MSRVDVRDRCRDSPERARSLLTVRAAISSARCSERPWSFSDSLTCSYWRARLVPSLTPRGGIGWILLTSVLLGYPVRAGLVEHAGDDHAEGHQAHGVQRRLVLGQPAEGDQPEVVHRQQAEAHGERRIEP